MELIWYTQSPDSNDVFPRESAIETSKCEARIEGELVGYVKVSYTTPELIAEHVPTPLHFKVSHGWCIGNIDTDDPVALWIRTFLYAGATPKCGIPGRSLRREHAPSDSECLAEIHEIGEKYRCEYDHWAEFFSVPFIAFSRVEPSHQRQGIATAMYLEAARQLGAENKLLRSSELRSDAAVGLWSALEADPTVNTSEISLDWQGGETTLYTVLDYRVPSTLTV